MGTNDALKPARPNGWEKKYFAGIQADWTEFMGSDMSQH